MMKKNEKQVIIIIGFWALSMFFLVGCASKPKSTGNSAHGSNVSIGVNLELSGNAAAYGQAALKGINYASEQINDAGGIKINGQRLRLKLIVKDNTSNNYQTAMSNSNLASNAKVSAIIGPCVSANVAAGLPKATEASVPVLTSQGTSDTLTLKRDGSVQPDAFRACYTDSYQGVILAHFADLDLKADTVAILGDKTSDYSAGLIKAFKGAYKGKIVDTQYYQAGDKDFSATLTKLKTEKFKALFVPGYYNEAGLIIKQARQLGIKAAILGPDGFSDDTLFKLAGKKNSNDIYYTNHFDSLAAVNNRVEPFIKSYKQKFHEEPSGFTALGYDAVYMIKAAMENKQSTNSIKVAQGLANLKDFQGVTGNMTMDRFHNPKKDVIVVKYDHGVKVSAKAVK
ncbi:ABC transporter substrate-binding protein [Xylocopilactobacillus apicola]|uniref:Branched-chain amino acid ABC transporter substrate-binding protein n=1 Tax=Xylocopilactobacillus apicola TaxID=2932184 RepID=A0AAU9D665_9LACO|nr:ABC transporter substrate-binding protein [Xylocopilactobacillus apicola]BDR57881.1 branched-chain amino acid ABC transporter substrate-binding protein [Xylocopilactobacillus apicola]